MAIPITWYRMYLVSYLGHYFKNFESFIIIINIIIIIINIIIKVLFILIIMRSVIILNGLVPTIEFILKPARKLLEVKVTVVTVRQYVNVYV